MKRLFEIVPNGYGVAERFGAVVSLFVCVLRIVRVVP